MTTPHVGLQEEFANSVSHGVGLILAVAATPILILAAAARGTAADIVGSSVFGASLVLLYLASASYHAAPQGPLKDFLRRVDHAAIYVLIAGTYTPFTLGILAGAWGWTLFGLVWGAAAFGMCAKLLTGNRYPRLSTTAYLAMGWLVLIAARPVTELMSPQGIGWLFTGGIFYSVGVVFYSARRLRFGHLVWHLFVLAGSACHTMAVLYHAI